MRRYAIDTRTPRVRHYQQGDVVEPEVVVEPPEQGTPGAAGQSTPASPPTDAGQIPAPDVQIAQAPADQEKAFDPNQLVKPVEKEFSHDEDVPFWEAHQKEFFNPENVRSHKGDHRFIDTARVTQQDIENHPNYPKFLAAIEMLKKQPPKVQNQLRGEVDKSYNRMRSDIEHKYNQQRQDQIRAETQELQGIDPTKIDAMRGENLDTNIATAFGAYDKSAYADKIKAATTAEDRQRGERARQTSPLVTLQPRELSQLSKNIIALNQDRNFDATDAATLIMDIATPVPVGMPGLNKLKGRAAANWEPDGRDAVGNYWLNTRQGLIRVSPSAYKTIIQAHSRGYDEGLKYDKKLADAREEEKKPGFFGRNVLIPLGLGR